MILNNSYSEIVLSTRPLKAWNFIENKKIIFFFAHALSTCSNYTN